MISPIDEPNGHNGNGNGAVENQPISNKKLGGCTGKGFLPGKSGNPGGLPGRPINIWSRIRKELLKESGKGKTDKADKVAQAFVDACRRGKWPQTKELIDREEGKVPDRVANADGSNIELLPITLDGDRQL